MQRLVLRVCAVLFVLLLVACAREAPDDARFVVTPEPGVPAFQQPTTQPGDTSVPSSEATTAYPAPSAADEASYPGPGPTTQYSSDGRSQTALTSYKLAEEVAKKEYGPEAQLYAIVPSEIMIANLGGGPVLPGWFYRFKNPGSPREFIVQVVDEIVTGTTIAEPLEPSTPPELPIDLAQVKLDSSEVLSKFEADAAEQNIQATRDLYDLELVNLEGRGGPIWSVVDPVTKQWLYSLSAVNGNNMTNPHQ